MLKLIIRIIFLVIAGVLIYDFSQTGSFQKSNTYKYMKESGLVDYGEIVLKEVKTYYIKAYGWAEQNVPVCYNEASKNLKPYISLSSDLLLILKSSSVSLLLNLYHYFRKNFPTAVDDVSTFLISALTATKEGLVILSAQLQNYTLSAVKYANEKFGS